MWRVAAGGSDFNPGISFVRLANRQHTEFPHMLKISSLHLFLTPLTPTTFMFLFHYHCEISPSPPACQVGLKSSLSLLWTSAEPSQSGLPAFTSNTSNVPLLSSVLRVSIAKATPHPLKRLRSSSVQFSVDKTHLQKQVETVYPATIM